MKDNKVLKSILPGLNAIGPGLYLIGYNIGTGSVNAMAKVGAEHGMSLIWTLLLSCIFTYVLMIAGPCVIIVRGCSSSMVPIRDSIGDFPQARSLCASGLLSSNTITPAIFLINNRNFARQLCQSGYQFSRGLVVV